MTPAGEAFVGYAATLFWRRLRLRYASYLLTSRTRPDSAAESRSTLQCDQDPASHDGELSWGCPALEVEGRWLAEAPGLERILLEQENGCVRWRCLQPRSRATVTLGGGRALAGQGYAEHLSLTLPPWRLPVRELRWGRFLSPSDAVVWIEWRGPRPLTLLVHNGAETGNAAIADHLVEFAGSSLRLSASQVLREGPLGRTVLSSIPRLQRFGPRAMRAAHEIKWCSRGVLDPAAGGGANAGWAIHEVVHLPLAPPP
ncbi:MAG TPA: hypothetical protein VHR45_05455 [Thermoanaerobaculia bacterium]|nr:hypothetical protein [Thermoanaerobaculia bacterium]